MNKYNKFGCAFLNEARVRDALEERDTTLEEVEEEYFGEED
jgi:hypothetical protein